MSAILVLVPAFLIGWSLHAHTQARNAALNGARYAAWERTVWREAAADGASSTAVRSTSEIEKFMTERFFVNPEAAIKSDHVAISNAVVSPFFELPNGDKIVDVEKDPGAAGAGKGARPKLTLEEAGDDTSSVESIYGVVSNIFDAFGGDKMELEDKGIYVGEVSLKLNAVKHLAVFDKLDLTIRQKAAVGSDAWSAGGRAHEEAISEPMVPLAMVSEALGPFFDFFRTGPLSEFAPFEEFYPGCVAGDVTPLETQIEYVRTQAQIDEYNAGNHFSFPTELINNGNVTASYNENTGWKLSQKDQTYAAPIRKCKN